MVEPLMDLGVRLPIFNGEGRAIYPSLDDCVGSEERPFRLRLDWVRQSTIAGIPLMMAVLNNRMVGIAKSYMEQLMGSSYLAERTPVEMEVTWEGFRYELPSVANIEMKATLIGSTIIVMTRNSLDSIYIRPDYVLPGIRVNSQFYGNGIVKGFNDAKLVLAT